MVNMTSPRRASTEARRAGAVDTGQVVELVQRHFGNLPGGVEPPKVVPGALPRQTRRYLTLEDDVHLGPDGPRCLSDNRTELIELV